MIEPTETVSKQDLDRFVDALIESSKLSPEELKNHPVNLPVSRPDEVKAARDMKVRWDGSTHGN